MVWSKGCFPCTLKITFRGETTKAWISPDKKQIGGGIPELQPFFDTMTWISPEEAAEIRNRPKQSVAAPEVPLPLNPGQCQRKYVYKTEQGNLLQLLQTQVTRGSWLSSLEHQVLASPPLLESLPSWRSGFTMMAMGFFLDTTHFWKAPLKK